MADHVDFDPEEVDAILEQEQEIQREMEMEEEATRRQRSVGSSSSRDAGRSGGQALRAPTIERTADVPDSDDDEHGECSDDECELVNGQSLPFASKMPGYNASWMGVNVDPNPPCFGGDRNETWVVYDEDLLDQYDQTSGNRTHRGRWFTPARVLCAQVQRGHYKDCEKFGDNHEHADHAAAMHQRACMAILGALTSGAAKGWVNGPNHQELVHAKKQTAASEKKDDASKRERQLDGRINSYTYCPNANKEGDRISEELRVFAQPAFKMLCETLYDETGTVKIGYRILIAVFDKGHSHTRWLKRSMEENSEKDANGRINQKSVDHRSDKHVKAAKSSRSINAPRLNIDNVHNISDWMTMLKMYEAKSTDEKAPALIDWSDIPPGFDNQAMEPDPKDMVGGDHSLSPEWILNFRRPGVSTAGMVDCTAGGTQYKMHPEQADPNNYFDEHGAFMPCEFSKKHRCIRVLVNQNGRDFMDVPLPEPMDSGCDVDDDLLQLFYEENRDSNAAIQIAIQNKNLPDSLLPDFRQSEAFRATLNGEEETDATEAARLKYVAEHELKAIRDVVIEQFMRLKTKTDVGLQGLAGQMTRLISQSLADDSLEATPEEIEKARADMAGLESYGTDSSGQHVLEPPQHLKRVSAELSNVHEFVACTYKRRKEESAEKLSSTDAVATAVRDKTISELKRKRASNEITGAEFMEQKEEAQVTCIESIKRAEQESKKGVIEAGVKCAKAMRGLHKLGLQQFEDAFQSKAARRTIPQGWLSIFEGTRKEFKWLADHASHCRVADAATDGTGTANIAFACGVSQSSKDVSPYGQWRHQLMGILSDVAQVQGGDVRVMQEAYYHSFEVAHPISFYLLLCGGAGIGKSMRMERLSMMFVKDWIRPAGPASEMAGQNGELDPICGSVEYHDEMTEEFSSNLAPRLEYLKRKASDNAFQRLRTCPELVNGQTRYRTKLLWSVHYETTVFSTNRGMCGTKEDEEPDANRAALVDRTVFHADASAPITKEEFQKHLDKPENRKKTNILRIIAGLTCHVLTYIKHLPFAQPDMAYAMRVYNEIDEIYCREYNIPKPSPRKQSKRKMTLLTFVVESAVVAKFHSQESAADFADMVPDENGNISGFSSEQLIDVVESMQMHVNLETIMLALSHAYDYFNTTTAHCFHVKLLLAQLHGCELDLKRLPDREPDAVQWKERDQPPPPAQQAQANAPHRFVAQPAGAGQFAEGSTSRDDATAQREQRHAQIQQSSTRGMVDAAALAASNAQASAAAEEIMNQNRTIQPPRSEGQDPNAQHDVGTHGPQINTYSRTGSKMTSVIQTHLSTRNKVREFTAGQKKMVRFRNILSSMIHKNKRRRDSNHSAYEHIRSSLASLVQDGDEETMKEVFIDPANDMQVDIEEATAMCMPHVQDLVDAGHPERLINDVVHQGFVKNQSHCVENSILGTDTGEKSGWMYALHNRKDKGEKAGDGEGSQRYDPDAAAYSFDYAQRKDMEQEDSASRQRIRRAARIVHAAALQGGVIINGGNVVQEMPLPEVSLGDTLYFLQSPVGDNMHRLSKQSNTHVELPKEREGYATTVVSMVNKDSEQSIRANGDGWTDIATRNSMSITKATAENLKMERVEGSSEFVCQGDNQLKLDGLVRMNDFVAAIPTDSFVHGQPIRFQNGVLQVHKKYMATQTQLAVLIAADLAIRPGVMHISEEASNGTRLGAFTVPVSMKRPRSAAIRDAAQKKQRTEAGPSSAAHDDDDNDDMEYDRDNQPVQSLFFHWDMLSMFLTYTAAEFFHLDCEDHVVKFRTQNPEVFANESLETTMNTLPHLVMRYAGRQGGSGHRTLMPLSVQVPREQSRVRKVEEYMASCNMMDSDLAIAKYLTNMNGYEVDADDPAVEEWKADQQGGMAMPDITGNLFSRSTWVAFTHRAMRNRMIPLDKTVLARLRDTGLNLRKRVLAHRIAESNREASSIRTQIKAVQMDLDIASNVDAVNQDDIDEKKREIANLEKKLDGFKLRFFSRSKTLGENTWHAIEREELLRERNKAKSGKSAIQFTDKQRKQLAGRQLDWMVNKEGDDDDDGNIDCMPVAKKARVPRR